MHTDLRHLSTLCHPLSERQRRSLNTPSPPCHSHGNEDKLATIMGVMQALISFVEEENDQLRCAWGAGASLLWSYLLRPLAFLTHLQHFPPMRTRWFIGGQHRFVFLKRDPLLLVAVAKTGEPYPHVSAAGVAPDFPVDVVRASPKERSIAAPPPPFPSWPCSSITSTTSSSPC